MLRRALSQSMQQLKLANSDAGAMVDRRVLKKLLLTWVERGRSDHSILNLMSSMLGFTGAPKEHAGSMQFLSFRLESNLEDRLRHMTFTALDFGGLTIILCQAGYLQPGWPAQRRRRGALE